MPFKDADKRNAWSRSYRKRWLRTPSGRASRWRTWRKYSLTRKGKATLKRRDAKRLAKNKEMLCKLKSKPCVDCGHKFPSCCMDFHHVRGRKKFRVGQAVNRSTTVILKEIAKCILLCANCHRIRHDKNRREK